MRGNQCICRLEQEGNICRRLDYHIDTLVRIASLELEQMECLTIKILAACKLMALLFLLNPLILGSTQLSSSSDLRIVHSLLVMDRLLPAVVEDTV